MKENSNPLRRLRVFLALVLIHAFLVELGGAQTPYYEGKTVTILRGGSPGGYGTLQAQALMPYLKKYIPGDSFIFIDHMPGAAGRRQTISTRWPNPMGSLSVLSEMCWRADQF